MQHPALPWNEEDTGSAARSLLTWFERHKRALPWREHYTPYEVWISEVMLQQTQMERGVAYWQRWMKRFPDVAAVAVASEESILQAWEGLGYYRRARFVHMAAKAMQERHQGDIPQNPEQLAALPGLGPYTVDAIRSIAFQHNVAAVDANVERVFSRLLNLDEPPKKQNAARRIRQAAESLLLPGHARDYNQALMELGALICKKAPLCPRCPLESYCQSRRLGLEAKRPVREEAAPRLDVLTAHGVLAHDGRALLHRRPDSGLWGGLWEFPGGEILPGETPIETVGRVFDQELGLKVAVERELKSVKHGYTNHRLIARFFSVRPLAPAALRDTLVSDRSNLRLVDCACGELAMPSHHRKVADRLFAAKGVTMAQVQGTL